MEGCPSVLFCLLDTNDGTFRVTNHTKPFAFTAIVQPRVVVLKPFVTVPFQIKHSENILLPKKLLVKEYLILVVVDNIPQCQIGGLARIIAL
jgi:hypothetical protein